MIVGREGPAVVLSAETAFYLERLAKLSAVRQRLRDGRHQRVSEELLHLREVAMSFDPSQLPPLPEVEGRSAEAATESEQWLSPVEVADLLGVGDRAVRLACSEGRLDAQQVGTPPRWRITRQAVQDFKAARSA